MQIYFHSRLWSYLPRVPILVEDTVSRWPTHWSLCGRVCVLLPSCPTGWCNVNGMLLEWSGWEHWLSNTKGWDGRQHRATAQDGRHARASSCYLYQASVFSHRGCHPSIPEHRGCYVWRHQGVPMVFEAVSSLADPPLAVRAAGVPRASALAVTEPVPLSSVFPVMAVTILCVWATHWSVPAPVCEPTPEPTPANESAPVLESASEPAPAPEVEAPAAEPPRLSEPALAPPEVAAPAAEPPKSSEPALAPPKVAAPAAESPKSAASAPARYLSCHGLGDHL